MPLGSPVTNKFSIGTAELRIGPLTDANKLTAAHSIGLIDSASLSVEQEAAELEGGFPRKLVDTAIIRQSASITATLREYSRRNIMTMLGEGVVAQTTDYAVVLDTQSVAGVTLTLPTGAGTNFTIGDIITVYAAGKPEEVSICRIDSIATDVLTLDTGTPLLTNAEIGDTVFLSHPAPVGAITQTNYFAVALVQKENSTGRPVVWNFWKGALASGLSMDTNAEDFASTDLEINLLEPAASEYGAGGALVHLNNVIPNNPIGFYAGGGDVSA